MELQITYQMRQALEQVFQKEVANYIINLIVKDQAHQKWEVNENGKTETGESDCAAAGPDRQGERQDCEEVDAQVACAR